MITERDLAVLRAVARYFVLNRPQVQRLCFPEDSDGRITRRRLIKLVKHGVLQKQPIQICDLDGGTPSAVYFPARRGLEIIAEHFSDKNFLRVSTQSPQPHCVRHWLAVSETHLVFDQAFGSVDNRRRMHFLASRRRIKGRYREWLVLQGRANARKDVRGYSVVGPIPQ